MSEASEHIQYFQDLLDSPVSSTEQAYQVRNDKQSKGILDAVNGSGL